MGKPSIQESFWKRGRSDTWAAIKSPFGMIFEVGGTALIGAMTQNGWVAVYFLGGVLIAIWIGATASAPYRQRNDERNAHSETRQNLVALTEQLRAKPMRRTLTDDQKSSLADVIRASGIRPEKITVTYDNAEAECADFAADIGDAIEMAGIITSVHDGVMLGRSVRDRGIKLYCGNSAVMKKLCDVIFNELKSLGFHPERRNAENMNKFFIDVARRSKN